MNVIITLIILILLGVSLDFLRLAYKRGGLVFLNLKIRKILKFKPMSVKLEALKSYEFVLTKEERDDQWHQHIYNTILQTSSYPELSNIYQQELPNDAVKYKLFFYDDVSYMKSTLWNTRNNKNLTVTNKLEDADFIIMPKYVIDTKVDYYKDKNTTDELDIRLSYIDGKLYPSLAGTSKNKFYDLNQMLKPALDTLLDKIKAIHASKPNYNPKLVQETDFNQVFYPYLILNPINSNVVDTLKLLFNASKVDMKQISSVLETCDYVKSNPKDISDLLDLVSPGIKKAIGYRSSPVRKIVHFFNNPSLMYDISVNVYSEDRTRATPKVLRGAILNALFIQVRDFNSLLSHIVSYHTPTGLIEPDFKLEEQLEIMETLVSTYNIQNLSVADIVALKGNIEDDLLRNKPEEKVVDQNNISTFIS